MNQGRADGAPSVRGRRVAGLHGLARRPSVWAAILIAAFAIRIGFVVTAPPRVLWADGKAYEEIGWRLASEHRYEGAYILAPGYPFFISTVYSIAGHDLFALRMTQAALSTMAAGLAGLFGAALFTPPVGLLAAALTAFHPVIAFLPVTQYAEDLLVLFSVLVFGLFALAVRAPSVVRWIGLGALYGLFMLVKPVALLYLPGLALGAALELGRAGRPRLRYGVVFAVALVAVLTPWTIRNHTVYGRFMLVSGGGDKFFWMANNENATGWEAVARPPGAWYLDSLKTYPDVFDQERFHGRLAREFIREHPGRAFQLYLIRLANLFSPYPRTVTRTKYTNSAADWAQGLYSLVLFLGAILGLARFARSRLSFLLFGMISYLLVASAFITILRYRMSMEILLIWMAALGYTAWLERSRAPLPGP